MARQERSLKPEHDVVKAALITSHERKSGIGALGSIVAHNLAWDAVISLNEAGLLATPPTDTEKEK